MRREIKSVPMKLKAISVPAQDVWVWLQEQVAEQENRFFLLAHADDGVIWGRIDAGTLITSPETEFSPPLRMETLQDTRLFGDVGEIFLWRDGNGVFHARVLIDGEGNPTEYYDEDQFLWGTHVEFSEGGFTQVSDGAQGLRHIVPIEINDTPRLRTLRLTVRHYLSEDDLGFVRVVHSRLVNVFAE